MNDMIYRQAAIDALLEEVRLVDGYYVENDEVINKDDAIEAIRLLPSAQPDNQVNLCDSCKHTYPDCPSQNDDVIFGNGNGDDNICACAKYAPSAQSEQKGRKDDEQIRGFGL